MDDDTEFFKFQAEQLLIHSQSTKRFGHMIASFFLHGVLDEPPPRNTAISIHNFWGLFDYCLNHHIDDLSLKLCKIVKSSSELPIVRTLAIFLIYTVFLTSSLTVISPETQSELKQTLLLSLRENISSPIFPILARVISILSYNVFAWIEYLAYIDWLIDQPTEFKKGIWLVIDLSPNVSEESSMVYVTKIKNKVVNYLDSQQEDDDVWGMAFLACLNLIVVLDEDEMVKSVSSRVKNSVSELMKDGKQLVLRKGFNILSFFSVRNVSWSSTKKGRFVIEDMISYILEFECVESETVDLVNRVLDGMSNTSISIPKTIVRTKLP